MIKAKIGQTSNMGHKRVKEFKDYNEMIEYMKNVYDCWVISWRDIDVKDFFTKPDEDKIDADIYLEIYDGCRE